MGAEGSADFVKVIEFDASADLSEKALREALVRLQDEAPAEKWADLVVHQSQILLATRLVSKNNAGNGIKLRALCESRIQRDDWRVATPGVEIRVTKA